MSVRSGTLATLLATLGFALAQGCSGQPGRSGEQTASTDEPIENGQPINSGADPFSTPFAASTVGLQITPAGGGNTAEYCTGVIVSSTQVLTAAHCVPPGSSITRLYQYSTTGATPPSTGIFYVNITGSNIAFPGSVGTTGCVNGVNYPQGCVNGGTFSDLAMITVPVAFDSNHPSVTTGVYGSFSEVRSHSAWEVGIGNLAPGASLISASAPIMNWVPVDLPPSDTGGGYAMPSSLYQEVAGSFVTRNSYADGGDSGGPVYQVNTSTWQPGEGPPPLMLVGITSGKIDATGAYPGTRYTSVLSAANYNWITTQLGGTPLFIRDQARAKLGLDIGLKPGLPTNGRADHAELLPLDGL